MSTEIWPIIKLALRKTVGEAAFTNWINPLELLLLDGSMAQFNAPTKFIGDWVARNYGDAIKLEFAKQGENIDRLSFGVKTKSSETIIPKAQAILKTERAKTGSADLPGAALDPRFTFDNFVVESLMSLLMLPRGVWQRVVKFHLTHCSCMAASA